MSVTQKKIQYTVASKVTIYCPMRFDSYPLDVQHCPFQLGSYGHNDSYMSFTLVKLVKETHQDISVLDYADLVKSLPVEHQFYSAEHFYSAEPNDNYTLTGFMLELRRKSFPYVVKFYLPSGLFVMVSWVILIIFVQWNSFVKNVYHFSLGELHHSTWHHSWTNDPLGNVILSSNQFSWRQHGRTWKK